MMRRTLLLTALFLAPLCARAADPTTPEAKTHAPVTAFPHWRGPNYNGTSAAINLPDKLDPAANLLWSTPLPGVGSSSPVVANGHIYLSSSDASTKKLRAFSVEVATGKIEWNHDVADIPPNNFRNTYASPSATADDKGATFLMGSSDLASFDNTGTARWTRKLATDYGRIANDWVYSSSTLLLNDILYVQALTRNESFLLGLNPADGKTKWKVARPTTAVGESHDSYATPIPMTTADTTTILLLGGDLLTAHDPATGKELWRFGGFNVQHKQDWRIIPSAVADDQRAYIPVARGTLTIAVKAGGSGDVTTTHSAWTLETISSDSPTPALANGTLYIIDSSRRNLHAVEAATGKLKTTVRLSAESAPFSASPTIADGKLYCMSESGEVVILAVDTLKVLSHTPLEDKGVTRSTITVIDGKLFVRTANKLWCFGNK